MAHAPLHLLCVEPRFPGRLGAVADWLVRRRGYRCLFYCHAVEDRATGRSRLTRDWTSFALRSAASPASRLWTGPGSWSAACVMPLVAGKSSWPGGPFPSTWSWGAPPGWDRPCSPRSFSPACRSLTSSITMWQRGPATWPRKMPPNCRRPTCTGVARPTPWQSSTSKMAFTRGPRPPGSATLFRLNTAVTSWSCTMAWTRAVSSSEGSARVVAGRTVPAGTKVVSFVARCTDRLRGFDRFLDLANRLIRAGDDVVAIVAGDPVVTNGIDVRFFGRDYRAHALAKDVPADPDRFWFLGAAAPAAVAELLAITDLHVYPSRPYPVSRTLVEAMAAGCVILAWDTPAVREFLTPETHRTPDGGRLGRCPAPGAGCPP